MTYLLKFATQSHAKVSIGDGRAGLHYMMEKTFT